MSPAGKPLSALHVPALDGLRGIAIVLVLLHQLNRIEGPELATRLVIYAFDFGWVGVQLFFVLSGFLITGILLDSRESPGALRSFFARRILRIFPLYFGVLALLVVILPALGLTPPGWGDHQIWYWLYLSNWTQVYVGGSLPHLWSLAVEEQFYLLWPFVVMRNDARGILRVCVVVAVASLAVRAAMVAAGVIPEAIYMFTTSRIDALLLGGAAAALLRLPGGIPARLASPRTLWLAALAVGIAGVVATRAYQRTTPMGLTVGYSTLALVFATAVLALALEGRARRPGLGSRLLATAPLRALGTYSYGMYIFHKPLHDLVGKPALAALGMPGPLGLGAGLAYVGIGSAIVFTAGMLSYELFERHFLVLKERFVPGPAGPGI